MVLCWGAEELGSGVLGTLGGVMVQPFSPWLVLFCGSDPPREKFRTTMDRALSVPVLLEPRVLYTVQYS